MADDKKQKTLFLDDPNAGAPRASSPPLSSQSTMMLESPAAGAQPVQPQRQMVVPTMMKMGPQGDLPPMQRRKKPSTWGRWVAGPILSAVVAVGTVYAAGILLPKKSKGGNAATGPTKPQGKLHVTTDPPGASILVDGKRYPRFTPTMIEGDIGSTVKLTFKLDGYRDNEAEVYMLAGEHNFGAKLESLTPSAPAPAAPAPAPSSHHEHHHATAAVPKEPQGKGKITVLVRPWAIVYLDNQKLKQTPVNDYEIASGHHVIELVNENKNRREKIDITLKPGEAQELRRDWDK